MTRYVFIHTVIRVCVMETEYFKISECPCPLKVFLWGCFRHIPTPRVTRLRHGECALSR